uniref:Uncharacterized protein n=1 Tax=viral metagenome TaxID=1070528 RepID=A0A6H2A3H8_9ZZZZ
MKLNESQECCTDIRFQQKQIQNEKTCQWDYDEIENKWLSECGGPPWCFPEGNLIENGMVFCPFCGRTIKTV